MPSRRKHQCLPEFDRLTDRLLMAGGISANLPRNFLALWGARAVGPITNPLWTVPTRLNVNYQAQGMYSGAGVNRFWASQVRSNAFLAGQAINPMVVPRAGTWNVPALFRSTPGNFRIFGRAGYNPFWGGLAQVNQGAGPVATGLDSGSGLDSTNTVAPPQPVSPDPVAPQPVSPPPVSGLQQTIVDLVNQERQQAGLAPLQVNAQLTAAAQLQANNMASLNQMSHVLDGVDQPTLEDRAHWAGYSYSALGENIAYNYDNAQDVMTGWMNSSGHRANILGSQYTEIGVGVAYNAYGEPYYCQVFGHPA